MALTWAKANPGLLPKEFNGSADNFVESWKTLRGYATQLSQENSELKKGAAAEGVEGEGTKTGEGEPKEEDLTALFIPNPDAKGEAENKAEGDGSPAAVNWQEVAASYVPGSGFPEATKEGLAKANVPADVVASFEAGQDALQRERLTDAARLVGGEANLKALTAAAAKLPKERRDQLNTALAADGWETVLVGLQAELATGKTLKGEPNEINTVQGDPTTAKPWGDQREMIEAMKNPLYKTSPEYRAEVQARCNLNATTRTKK